jgi:hypothetical protein
MSDETEIEIDSPVEAVGTPEPDESAGKETDLQVEVIDDTPPEDKNRPRRTGEPDIPADDEVVQYSDKVKKRISKLKYEFHEERRAKEELARQQQALVDYVKRRDQENAQLRRALQSGQALIADQMETRVQSELQVAQRLLKEAVEMGDVDKQIEAHKSIARLTLEADKVKNFRPVQIEEPSEPEQPQYVPQTPPPKPDAKTVSWARKNTWFGRDREMTDFARHVHDRLVVFDRVDPKTDEYWEKLDGEIRKRYPHLASEEDFEDNKAPQQKQSVVVAPVKRNTTPPRKVQLSASEVAIAKRLGLSIEQYAAEKLRSMNG